MNQQNNKQNQKDNPNISDNLRHLKELNKDNIPSNDTSSSTLDSLLSPSTLGIGSNGTGQNHSGGTASDRNIDKTKNQDE